MGLFYVAWKATRYATPIAEKAITDLGCWAITDHTGTAKLLANLPPLGFVNTLGFALIHDLFSIPAVPERQSLERSEPI